MMNSVNADEDWNLKLTFIAFKMKHMLSMLVCKTYYLVRWQVLRFTVIL